jgi:hypothetical protein
MTRAGLGLFFLSFLVLTSGCGGGSTTPPPSTLITVKVSAPKTTVIVGQSLTFTANITGTTNTAVTWSVAGGASNGSITSSGVYTAPTTVPSPPTVTVTATSQAAPTKSGSATVTVVASASGILVSVQPAVVSVSDFMKQQFGATVTGTGNTAVTWQVNGVNGGSQKFGFISGTGLFVAPSAVPTKSDSQGNTVTTTLAITAVSQSDATDS